MRIYFSSPYLTYIEPSYQRRIKIFSYVVESRSGIHLPTLYLRSMQLRGWRRVHKTATLYRGSFLLYRDDDENKNRRAIETYLSLRRYSMLSLHRVKFNDDVIERKIRGTEETVSYIPT